MAETRFIHFMSSGGKRGAALLLGLLFLMQLYACQGGGNGEGAAATGFSDPGLPTGQIDPNATMDPSVVPDNLQGTIRLLVKNDLREKGDNQAMRQCIANYVSTFQMYYPNISVQIRYVDEMNRELKADADVFLLTAEDSLRYMADEKYDGTGYARQFLDLSDYYERFRTERDQLLLPAMKLGQVGASQQWIPFQYDRAVIYADKRVFEEAGAEIPSADWTYEDFTKLVGQLTFTGKDGRYTGLYLAYHQAFVWKLFVRGTGGEWFDPAQGKAVLTEGKVYEGFRTMFSMLENGTARGKDFNQNGSAVSKSAMAIAFACQPERDGVYVESLARMEANPAKNAEALMAGENLIMLPLPFFSSGAVGVSNTAFCKGFAVSVDSGQKEAAAAFALFALTLPGQQTLNQYFGGIPVNRRAFVSDFWKKGLLAGSNADTVLLRIDADERDDFLEAFEGAKYLYKGVLRTRTLFASLLYRDYAAVQKRKPESYRPTLEALERHINAAIRDYT